jgi:hypothetical protein
MTDLQLRYLEFRVPPENLIDTIYPNINLLHTLQYEEQQCFLQDRVILCPLNVDVDSINASVLAKFANDEIICTSADSATDSASDNDTQEPLLPTEYLNTLNMSGLPLHQLVLKIGCPIILLRNLDPAKGLCNGTRLMLTAVKSRVLEATILSGQNSGTRAFIPRITLTSAPNMNFPFTLRRRQFPVRLAFAMTINKAQGQSVRIVGVNLTTPAFAHGQLYVALSRATNMQTLYVALPTENLGTTANIVYREALSENLRT